MAETETETAQPPPSPPEPVEVAPSESVAPRQRKGRPKSTGGVGRKPKRARRFNFYPDGLDYVLLAVEQGADGQPVPNGKLSAIPGMRDDPDYVAPSDGSDDGKPNAGKLPLRFNGAQEAVRWIRASGEQLAGQKITVVRMCEQVEIVVESTPRISVNSTRRHMKSKDPAVAVDVAPD